MPEMVLLRDFRKERAGMDNDPDEAEETCWLCGGVWTRFFREWDGFLFQLTNSKNSHFVIGKDNYPATYNSKMCKTNNSQFIILIIIIIIIIAKMH